MALLNKRPRGGRFRGRIASHVRVAAGLVGALVGLAAWPAAGAFVRPLEGGGNFHCVVDVLNRHEDDGSVSVVVQVSIANREITFREKEARLVGELLIAAVLEGDDGAAVRRETRVDLRTRSREEARASTLYQIVPLVLEGVRVRSGRLTVTVQDVNRERPGLMSLLQRNRWAYSEAVGDWTAPATRREPGGLAVGDPLFLARAPIAAWARATPRADAAPASELLTEYLHPNRRYGLEQPRLQVYFEVDPPADGGAAEAARDGLFVQVLARDLDFALRDTIRLDEGRLAQLAAGGAAGVYYDLDLKDLPAGGYQLSVAPANAQGRAWIAEFDVLWDLEGLDRHAEDLTGEARTVLYGDERDAFDDAGPGEREAIMERFWARHDPDPETSINEGRLEFRRRVSYVRQRLGGFNAGGARDPRGQIYLLLGAPDEVSRQVLPINKTDQEEAKVRVFDNFAPEREGTWMKRAGDRPDISKQSARELAGNLQGTRQEKGYELWVYDASGRSLFAHPYSHQVLGIRFLFVDRTGTGVWILESTNAVDIGG